MLYDFSKQRWHSLCKSFLMDENAGLFYVVSIMFVCFFKSLGPSDAIWWQGFQRINIGSGNGWLPDGTKLLPEPLLTYQQSCPVTFIWGQFHESCQSHWSWKGIWKLVFLNCIYVSRGSISLWPVDTNWLCHWCKQLGHQQPIYWFGDLGIFSPQDQLNELRLYFYS